MRTISGTLPTDYTFTGQKLDASSRLMYYGARYYDAAIGRFAQPDSIVPNLYNPQSLNRYSYVLNNPLRYTDPTGHGYCDDHICEGDYDLEQVIAEVQIEFGVDVSSEFNSVQAATLQHALRDFADAVGGTQAARAALGGARYAPNKGELLDKNGPYTGQLRETIYITPETWHQHGFRKETGPRIAAVHEGSHYWDWKEGSEVERALNMHTLSANMPVLTCALGGCEQGPTWAGRLNSTEDWAETVTSWVYPEYIDIIRAEPDPFGREALGRPAGEGGPGLGGLHITFLFRQIYRLGGW